MLLGTFASAPQARAAIQSATGRLAAAVLIACGENGQHVALADTAIGASAGDGREVERGQ